MKINAERSIEGPSGGPVAADLQRVEEEPGSGKRSARHANLMTLAVVARLCAACKCGNDTQ